MTGFRKPRAGGGGYLNLRDDDNFDPQIELYDHGRRHEYDNDDPTARWIDSWWPTAHNDDDTVRVLFFPVMVKLALSGMKQAYTL